MSPKQHKQLRKMTKVLRYNNNKTKLIHAALSEIIYGLTIFTYESVNTNTVARDVDRTDDAIETAILAALSDLGSQTQPDKVADMATSQSSPLAAVLRPVINDVEVILDDGNMLQDEGISKEVNQSELVRNLNGEKGKQVVVQKEGNGHVSVLSGPLLQASMWCPVCGVHNG